ncbi:putative F-box protein PP2-B12 [Chenopodium quinoa]|uniref:putative F-box protein PP2-B12 n=1 Tax=Chenopodium quinoa TaxID=63459 RepID=UPI000B78A124|nr:putative F-box protein PP2-B12 [Chenopodium quinoa]
MSCMNILDLPEECLSYILSLTSPVDVLKSQVVSKQLYLALGSNTVWEKFLPSDCTEIISQSSVSPILHQLTSKKDLFLHLCRSPILLNNNTQSFGLNKWNGKKCYMLGARALMITWGGTPQYWSWSAVPESRFPEATVLKNVCWLDIKGKMHTKVLSPKTTYGAYFVFKMDVDNHQGFEDTPVNVSISEVTEEGLPTQHYTVVVKQFYLEAPSVRRPEELPVTRGDGWMEIEMGRYQVGADADQGVVLEMSLREVEELNWKRGLIVHGIELRPLD